MLSADLHDNHLMQKYIFVYSYSPLVYYKLVQIVKVNVCVYTSLRNSGCWIDNSMFI